MSSITSFITATVVLSVCFAEGKVCYLHSFTSFAGGMKWALLKADVTRCKQLLLGGHRSYRYKGELLIFEDPFVSTKEEAVKNFLCKEANICNRKNIKVSQIDEEADAMLNSQTPPGFDSSSLIPLSVEARTLSCTSDTIIYNCTCNNSFGAGEPRSCYCLDNNETGRNCTPNDCYQLKEGGIKESGLYTIETQSKRRINVSCNMTDGGGWTIIQRRMNGSVQFYRGWTDYKDGFGVENFEFWLGNENIHHLTRQRRYELRIEIVSRQGHRLNASYDNFSVSGEAEYYQLKSLGNFTGSQLDSADPMRCLETTNFTTCDKDNDRRDSGNCANATSSGWWFNGGSGEKASYDGFCKLANLNGVYWDDNDSTGIVWNKETGWAFIEMKIQPYLM